MTFTATNTHKMIVQKGQTLADITLQAHGTLDAIIGLALINGISITEPLASGTTLEENTFNGRPEITAYYRSNAIFPATGLTDFQMSLAELNDPCDLCKLFKTT